MLAMMALCVSDPCPSAPIRHLHCRRWPHWMVRSMQPVAMTAPAVVRPVPRDVAVAEAVAVVAAVAVGAEHAQQSALAYRRAPVLMSWHMRCLRPRPSCLPMPCHRAGRRLPRRQLAHQCVAVVVAEAEVVVDILPSCPPSPAPQKTAVT